MYYTALFINLVFFSIFFMRVISYNKKPNITVFLNRLNHICKYNLRLYLNFNTCIPLFSITIIEHSRNYVYSILFIWISKFYWNQLFNRRIHETSQNDSL